MGERTLAIIKPDAVKKRVIGDIIRRYEGAGLQPIEMKMLTLSKKEAEEFYAVHRERPFFGKVNIFISIRSRLLWRTGSRGTSTNFGGTRRASSAEVAFGYEGREHTLLRQVADAP